MKNLTDKQKEFLENGFYIERNVFDTKDMEEIFINFYDICFNIALKHNIKHKTPIPNNVSYPNNLKDLDYLVLAIFNVNKDLLGEVYDTFSYSLTFMRFLGNKKVENITQELLNINKTSSLYGWTNRMRIDPPSDERRTYGWHQEIFYTFPDTKFLQTWCPMMRDTTIENGTIEIAPIAFMRGRTLEDCYIILDEAQNTSLIQMKMFLTRLGKNSKMVVAGDKTQIDLVLKTESGLVDAEKKLQSVQDIGFVYLSAKDVVRHELVQKIIDAYER